jgi:hypothetical protein
MVIFDSYVKLPEGRIRNWMQLVFLPTTFQAISIAPPTNLARPYSRNGAMDARGLRDPAQQEAWVSGGLVIDTHFWEGLKVHGGNYKDRQCYNMEGPRNSFFLSSRKYLFYLAKNMAKVYLYILDEVAKPA